MASTCQPLVAAVLLGTFCLSACVQGGQTCLADVALQTGSPPVSVKQQATCIPFDAHEELDFATGTGTAPPALPVTLNGSNDCIFILDTGCNKSLIKSSIVSQLHLIPMPASSNGSPILDLTGKQADEVSIGETKVGNFVRSGEMLVLPDDQSEHNIGPNWSGVLGINYLESFVVLVNFKDHMAVLLAPGKLSQTQRGIIGFQKAAAVPFAYDPATHLIFVSAEVTSGNVRTTLQFMVDTGATFTVLSRQDAAKFKLKPLPSNYSSRFITPISEFDASFSVIDALRVGPIILQDQKIASPTTTKGLAFSILGLDILSRYKLLIDFPANVMYMLPDTTPTPTFPAGHILTIHTDDAYANADNK